MYKPPKISLAAVRVNAKKTQEEVAEALGVSKSTVINWENYRTTPSYEMVKRMEKLYSYPFDFVAVTI